MNQLYSWPIGNEIDIRTGKHCLFLMHVHLVFRYQIPKQCFTKNILNDLKDTFAKVCDDFKAELIECDGEDDHVHLLVNYPPKVPVSKWVNSLKGVSSRLVRKKELSRHSREALGQRPVAPSHFASSGGGAPISVITR